MVLVTWMSGLNRHPAKVLFVEIRAVGSNPTVTAKQLALLIIMVVDWFCNPGVAVRFCQGAPKNIDLQLNSVIITL
jgi:hypothetical protein